MKTTLGSATAFSRSTWVLALLALVGAASCFRSLDPVKVPCSNDTRCPAGYSCARAAGSDRGHCILGTIDGGRVDQALPPGVDGQAGADGSSPRDGLRDSVPDGAGNTSSSDTGVGGGAGGTGGGAGGTGGGAGGIGGGSGGGSGGAADAPLGTGGTISTGGTTATSDGPLVPVDAGLPKGAPCASNGQCASASCVDGVCCDKACTGCNACSNAMTGEADGTCAPVAVGKDPHDTCADETATQPCGNDGTCDGKGGCRKVGSGLKCGVAACSTDGTTFTPEPKCDGTGTCVPGTAQVCTPYECATTGCKKACTTQSQCDSGTYCNTTTGTCATKKTNGTPATQTYECQSGVVADGVCCDKECTGCSACTAALNGQAASTTGSCLAVTAAKAADPHGACPAGSDPCGTDGTCNGTGACRYAALGSDCGTPSCAASMLTKSACSSSHTCTAGAPAACPGSMACASATACKTGTCASNADCASGYTCQSGACAQTLGPGSVCTANNQCSSNACVDGRCCGQPACGTCQACTGTGGTCVAVANAEDPDTCSGASSCNATGVCKKKQGQPCSAASDCGTGYCADGVCCDRACNGACEYCNNASSPGSCGYTSGAPKSGHPACSGSGTCQGTCDGSKATCSLPGGEVSCRAASCDGTTNVQTNPASCNGTGTCPSVSTYACSPFRCGSTSCLTSCSSGNQCVSGAACIGGVCQTCGSGQTACGTVCANTSSDPAHCGNCTTTCGGSTPYCVSGACGQCRNITDCGPGWTNCDATTHSCVCKQKSANNKLVNPGFDVAMALSPWQSTSEWATAVFSTDDSESCPGSGSGHIIGMSNLWQCMNNIGPGVSFGFGFKYKGVAMCSAMFYSASNCNSANYISGVDLGNSDSGGTSWWPLTTYGTTPAGTQSVEVWCTGAAGDGFLDQMFFNTSGGGF